MRVGLLAFLETSEIPQFFISSRLEEMPQGGGKALELLNDAKWRQRLVVYGERFLLSSLLSITTIVVGSLAFGYVMKRFVNPRDDVGQREAFLRIADIQVPTS